ncbi:hypothetical protein [Turicimonas muris]|uniref:hypothetical protein n=1 Tax=Turicimonas muris TaxID=1796652 RepID=UPI0023F1B03C|nr:hypothetical protein [Turicimonas muris]
MKYRIKNRQLEKTIFALFDRRAVMKSIAEQMPDDSTLVSLSYETGCPVGTQLHSGLPSTVAFDIGVTIPKSEIEEEPEE